MVGASEELEMGDEKDCASVMDLQRGGFELMFRFFSFAIFCSNIIGSNVCYFLLMYLCTKRLVFSWLEWE